MHTTAIGSRIDIVNALANPDLISFIVKIEIELEIFFFNKPIWDVAFRYLYPCNIWTSHFVRWPFSDAVILESFWRYVFNFRNKNKSIIPANKDIIPKENVSKKEIVIRTIVLIRYDPKVVRCLNATRALVGCSVIRFIKWPVSFDE